LASESSRIPKKEERKKERKKEKKAKERRKEEGGKGIQSLVRSMLQRSKLIIQSF
jgi:hypothetical protein